MANGLMGLMSGGYPIAQMAEQGGLNALLQQQAAQPLQQQIPQVQTPRPGTFERGGRGWEILGIIGDALQTAGGGRATYAPAIAEQRQLEEAGRQKLAQYLMEQEQRKADREASLAGQKELIDYRAANPGQTQLQQNYEYARSLPGQEGMTFPQFMSMYKPQIMGSAETGYYNMTPGVMGGGGLPQGYDPNEWEVVPGGAGSGQGNF